MNKELENISISTKPKHFATHNYTHVFKKKLNTSKKKEMKISYKEQVNKQKGKRILLEHTETNLR